MAPRARAFSPAHDSEFESEVTYEPLGKLLGDEYRKKVRGALKDFKAYVLAKKLPLNYIPNHGDFELAPLSVFLKFAKSYANIKTGKIQEEMAASSLYGKVNNLLYGMNLLLGRPLGQNAEGQTADDINRKVQQYVNGELVREGLVTQVKKVKFEFDRKDIEKTQDVLWTVLDPNCNSVSKVRSGRYLVFQNACLYLFSTYGSRISAVVPKLLREPRSSMKEISEALGLPEAKNGGPDARYTNMVVGSMVTGLRYKDIEVLFLRRDDSEEHDIVVMLSQRFFKGNQNTEEIALHTWATVRETFLRDHTPYVLAYAFADEAFRKFPNAESLFTHKMSSKLESEVCAWREEIADKHIFRARRGSDKPYSQFQWDHGLKLATKQAGYTESITIHRIRQATVTAANASGVNPEQHSKLFGQQVSTFRKSYLDKVVPIDLQAVVTGEPQRLDIGQKLKSARRTLCRGQPIRLTSLQRASALKKDATLRELEEHYRQSQDQKNEEGMVYYSSQIAYHKRRAWKAELKEVQKLYRQKHIDGTDIADDKFESAIPQQRWKQLLQFQPHYARVSEALVSGRYTTNSEQLALVEDLTQLARQEDAILCTVGQSIMPYDIAKTAKLGYYAYHCPLCLHPIQAGQTRAHLAQVHLPHPPMDCGVFYYTTERSKDLVNPGTCPFCLGNDELPLHVRFNIYKTKRRQFEHISKHFTARGSLNLACPHPACSDTVLPDLVEHFESVHGIDELGFSQVKRANPSSFVKETRGRKRKSALFDGDLVQYSGPSTTYPNLPVISNPDLNAKEHQVTNDFGHGCTDLSIYPLEKWDLPEAQIDFDEFLMSDDLDPPEGFFSDSSEEKGGSSARATSVEDDEWLKALDTVVIPYQTRRPEQHEGLRKKHKW